MLATKYIFYNLTVYMNETFSLPCGSESDPENWSWLDRYAVEVSVERI